jgi:hypothetical protein
MKRPFRADKNVSWTTLDSIAAPLPIYASNSTLQTVSRPVGLTALYSTFRTQRNLPTTMFIQPSVQDTTAPFPDYTIPHVQSFPSIRSKLSELFPYPDLVADRVYIGNAFGAVSASPAGLIPAIPFTGNWSFTDNVNTGNSLHSADSHSDTELGVPSSSCENAAFDFAFATRAASFESPYPHIELIDWKGNGKESET